MSLILAEGFDIYAWLLSGASYDNWIADSRITHDSSRSAVLPASGREGRGCLRLDYAFGNYYLGLHWVLVSAGAEYSTIFHSFAYKVDSSANAPETSFPIFIFQTGTDPLSGYQYNITRTASDALQVRSTIGGTVLGQTADGIITPGFWQYIEIKSVCHSTNGSVTIKIDGTQVLNVTGINTQATGSGGIKVICIRKYNNTNAYQTYIDDLIIYDDQGSTFNDFMGDMQVVGLLPVADGSDTDWTSTEVDHYDSVNDVGSGYDSTYIESAIVNNMDSFDVTPSGTYPSILGVEVAAYGYNSGGGTVNVTPYVRIGGIVYYGTAFQMSAGSTDKRSYVWESNPATGTLWSKAVVDSSEFGFEVTSLT